MTWNDDPTDSQLRVVYNWLKWELSTEQAQEAVAWLENTATRREVSIEMSRLRTLKKQGLLDSATCFESEIWEGFEHE